MRKPAEHATPSATDHTDERCCQTDCAGTPQVGGAGTGAGPGAGAGLPSAVLIWVAAVGVFVAARYRGGWHLYQSLQQWLADSGVPAMVRALDYPLILIGGSFAIAAVAWRLAVDGRASGPLDLLRLHAPRRGWASVTLLAAAPMVMGGMVLMLSRGHAPALHEAVPGVVRAPIVEEILFRGAMVAVPVALIAGRWFWWFACASAAVFGAAHIAWTFEGLNEGWATIAVTAAGGVWYAWLMRAWRSVFVPMLLHAAMNLGWFLAGSSGAAGGGLIENLLRAATITIATWLTIRAVRDRSSFMFASCTE